MEEIMGQPVLKTPEQWSEKYKVLILDPDGWRGVDSPSWDEPITEEDFVERMSVSTIGPIGFYDKKD